MKKGLVLEGGAMRGLFTAGIIDVFLENNVGFDGVIGVSAGAAFGCNYKSKQIGRVIRYNTRFCRDKRYGTLWSWFKTGDLYSADFCYREIPRQLDPFDVDAFIRDPSEFYVVCTDIKTGKAVYKKLETLDDTDMDWVRASASMPLVSKAVSLDGFLLLDGGIADSIPVKEFEKMGYDRNVVILTRPENYVKKQNKLLMILNIVYRKYPRFLETLKNRYAVYNETLDYLCEREKSGDIFVIRPESPLQIGKTEHNPDVMRRVYDTGRAVGQKRLAAVTAFLNG